MVWPGAATALLPTALIPSPAPAPARRRELSEVLAAARAQPCACAGPWVSAAPQDAAVHAALAARGALILRVTDFHRSWDRGERHNPQKETERRNQTRVSRDFSCILFVAATFLLGWPVVVL